MCTSDTSCVLGDQPGLALLVALTTREDEMPSVSPPFEDPEDATERSCGIASLPDGQGTPWLLLVAAALGVRRWRARAAR
jgi:hypothetical protein